MDELRALAFLDLLLNRDSRPSPGSPPGHTSSGHQNGNGTNEPGSPAGGDPGPGPGGGVIPAGFAGKINLTVPATTLLDLADRPGEITGIGPVDPNPGANT